MSYKSFRKQGATIWRKWWRYRITGATPAHDRQRLRAENREYKHAARKDERLQNKRILLEEIAEL